MSAPRPRSFNLSKYFFAASTDSAANSAIDRFWNRTAKAVGLSRVPSQLGHTASLAFPPVIPPDFLAGLFGIKAAHQEPRAVAALAPAVLGVIGEQPRVELGEAAAAARAGALRGKGGGFRAALIAGGDDLQHTLAEEERAVNQHPHFLLTLWRHRDFTHGQFDVVFSEARQPRPVIRWRHAAVHTQKLEAFGERPLGEIGVIALARGHQRRQHQNSLAPMFAHDPRQDCLRRLRLDWNLTLRTVLRAELHEQQAQEVVNLGEGRDRALASAARGALFDGHRRR